MSLVFEVDQRPELFVTPENDAASRAAVAAVGPSESDEFFTPEMGGTGSAVSGPTENFHVIDKVG